MMDLFSDYSSEVINSEESADRKTNSENNIEDTENIELFKEVEKLNDDKLEGKLKDEEESEKKDDEKEEKSKLIKIKELCLRTDISALAKVDQILQVIDPKPPSPVKEHSNGKRAAEDVTVNIDPKHFKAANEDEDDDGKEVDSDLDSCVVCGLSLMVFKGDKMKEFHHYLSHGFRILKEFEVLKPDDSLFLMCNICSR